MHSKVFAFTAQTHEPSTEHAERFCLLCLQPKPLLASLSVRKPRTSVKAPLQNVCLDKDELSPQLPHDSQKTRPTSTGLAPTWVTERRDAAPANLRCKVDCAYHIGVSEVLWTHWLHATEPQNSRLLLSSRILLYKGGLRTKFASK